METSGECMTNDAALEVVVTSGVTLGSYQVQGGRGHEFNMKWQG